MTETYGADLAYIHDAGFRDYSRRAAPGVLALLRRNRVRGGLVVDLGCGSGRWACQLTRRGYAVLGIEQSAAFVRIAREVAPSARFVRGSLWNVNIPSCDAVTAIGECINYVLRRRSAPAPLFRRIHNALRPGGIFVFDAAAPDRIPPAPRQSWMEGTDWAILAESRRGPQARTLVRRIVAYRKIGARFRRSEETHVLRLYSPAEILGALIGADFEAEELPGYGRFRPFEGIHVYLARRPLTRI
ncbi:MAG TPA: class I SAM-dependent methyltransferase [Bryobacteraceae bacterium]